MRAWRRLRGCWRFVLALIADYCRAEHRLSVMCFMFYRGVLRGCFCGGMSDCGTRKGAASESSPFGVFNRQLRVALISDQTQRCQIGANDDIPFKATVTRCSLVISFG